MYRSQPQTTQSGAEQTLEHTGAVIRFDSLTSVAAREAEDELRCVSSGYLGDGCSCSETLPKAVVDAAWEREITHGASAEDRFFHFACEGEVWLAFGRTNGGIRGIYCPAHRAERDARARREVPSGGAPVMCDQAA